MANVLQIPEMVNDFNAYTGGNKMVGTSGEISLAEIQSMVQTVSGMGVLGEYDAPAVGHYSAINQEIPFRMLDSDFASILNPGSTVDITLRSANQYMNRTDGSVGYRGMRLVFRGRCTDFKPGTVKQAAQMDASVTISCTYVLVEIDGQNKFELDKVNGVCKINGVDVLAAIKALC